MKSCVKSALHNVDLDSQITLVAFSSCKYFTSISVRSALLPCQGKLMAKIATGTTFYPVPNLALRLLGTARATSSPCHRDCLILSLGLSHTVTVPLHWLSPHTPGTGSSGGAVLREKHRHTEFKAYSLNATCSSGTRMT